MLEKVLNCIGLFTSPFRLEHRLEATKLRFNQQSLFVPPHEMKPQFVIPTKKSKLKTIIEQSVSLRENEIFQRIVEFC